MPLDLVIGAQWGDEGKGRLVDVLSAKADVVARFNGGDNAGHTVTVGTQIFKLHLIPSGIVHPHPVCVMGNGMVVNPAKLLQEIDQLAAIGVDVSPQRLKLSTAAHLITPIHLALDGAEEASRSMGGLGTTRRGIGPAYSEKAARRGLRAGLMSDPSQFRLQLADHLDRSSSILRSVFRLEPPDPAETVSRYGEYAERLRPHLADVGTVVADALRQDKVVLGEGAQGTLLDLDHGTYPYVTSSNPTTAGALQGLGVGPTYLRRIIGVAKSFQTRVGTGPFPTELHDEIAIRLRGTGEQPWDEFGTTTGRPRRCGWLDAVLLRYASRINGFTELALTKLDVLSGLNKVQLCVAYQISDRRYQELPDATGLAEAAPEYETLPGWETDLWSCQSWKQLPDEAQAYVQRVEELTGLPIKWISVGPERQQALVRGQ